MGSTINRTKRDTIYSFISVLVLQEKLYLLLIRRKNLKRKSKESNKDDKEESIHVTLIWIQFTIFSLVHGGIKHFIIRICHTAVDLINIRKDPVVLLQKRRLLYQKDSKEFTSKVSDDLYNSLITFYLTKL